DRGLTDNSDLAVSQMHGPAPPLADSGRLAVELCHQGLQIRAFANRMPVRAMRAGDVVIIAQRQARADDGRLLTAARMHPGELPRHSAAHGFLFEPADAYHAPVRLEREVPRQPRCHHLPGVPIGLLYM